MSEHWVCLDLFSGLGGFSQDFEDSPEWEVVTVDIEERFEPDLCADVLDLHPADLLDAIGIERERVDVLVILASPPCRFFTTIRNCTKGGDDAWSEDGEPQTAGSREALALVYHTVGLIRALAPDFWFMENPRGMLRKRYREPEATVWYCQYGSDNAKPTDLWGDHPHTFRPQACYHGNDHCGHTRTESHREHGGGSDSRAGILVETDSAERAKVPLQLSEAIREAVEEAIENPPPEQATLPRVVE